MKDVNKLIETVISTKALAAYLTAEKGETFGIYADNTFTVGESIGSEINPKERPIACIRCPGISNIDTTYFTDDFVTYNHVTGMYESIEQDRTGEIDTYTLAGVIRECCENGDVDIELQELKDGLIAAWMEPIAAAQRCMSQKPEIIEVENAKYGDWLYFASEYDAGHITVPPGTGGRICTERAPDEVAVRPGHHDIQIDFEGGYYEIEAPYHILRMQ